MTISIMKMMIIMMIVITIMITTAYEQEVVAALPAKAFNAKSQIVYDSVSAEADTYEYYIYIYIYNLPP